MRRVSSSEDQSQDNCNKKNGPNGWRFNQSYAARQMAYKHVRTEVVNETGLSSYFVKKNLTTDTHLAPTYGNSFAVKYYPRAPPNSPRPIPIRKYQNDLYTHNEKMQIRKVATSDDGFRPKVQNPGLNPNYVAVASSDSQNKILIHPNMRVPKFLPQKKKSVFNKPNIKYPETRFDYCNHSSGDAKSDLYLHPSSQRNKNPALYPEKHCMGLKEGFKANWKNYQMPPRTVSRENDEWEWEDGDKNDGLERPSSSLGIPCAEKYKDLNHGKQDKVCARALKPRKYNLFNCPRFPDKM